MRVRLHRPAAAFFESPGLCLLVEGAYELGGALEGRIVRAHTGEREHGRHRTFHAPFEEHVADGHLEQVADLPLAQGATHVQWHRVHHSGCRLLLQEDPADLRAVPVRDDHLVPQGGDIGDALGRPAGSRIHLLERVIGPATQQSVSPQGYHHPFHRAGLQDG